jgi:biopolymer transport protein TolR
MGMTVGGGGKGRRKFASEINVTPLVDVMLVLLIIFMITAPMMTQGIDINLPQTSSKALRQQADEPLVVQVDSDGKIYIGTTEFYLPALHQELARLPEEKRLDPIYLQADRDVPYGMVVQVMAQIKEAGFEKLGMVTLPEAEVY